MKVYVTQLDQLQLVLDDLLEYKKHFGDQRAKIGFDMETMFTDDLYRERMLEYEDKPIPQCYPTPDGGWEGIPRLIQIGLDPLLEDRQYVIDTQPISNGDGTFRMNPEFVKEFRRVFKDFIEKDALLIGQNIKYDLTFLALIFGIFPPSVRCTMLMAMIRNNGDKLLLDNQRVEYRLDALYNRYIPRHVFIELTGMTPEEYHDFKKTNQTSDWSGILDETQIQYAADDVRLIFFLYHYLMKDCGDFVKKYPKAKLAQRIKEECDFTLEAGLMQSRGMGMDADYQKNVLCTYLQEKVDEADEALVKYKECWIEMTSELKCPKTNPHYITWCQYINVDPHELRKGRIERKNSGPRLARALVENFGLELPKTEKGADSIAGETLRELFWKMEKGRKRDILGKVLQFRKACSFLSKNGENQLSYIHSDGRVHPQYKQHAAETARMAAVNPAVMTIPKRDKMFGDPILGPDGKPLLDKKGGVRIKDAFYLFGQAYVARDGFLVIDSDFSNEEVRVLGDFTGDKEIIKAFTAYDSIKKKVGLDLHQLTADNLGVDRYTGKLFFLASMYGAYERRIMEFVYDESGGEVDLDYDTTKQLRIKHFEKYYGLKAAIDQCAADIEEDFKDVNSLTEYLNRKALKVGITKKSGAHRIWALTKEQEQQGHNIIKYGKIDYLHRNYKKLNEDTGRESTFWNSFNQKKGEIIREYFNYLIQTECSLVLKRSVVDISRAFRAEGFDPLTEGIILTCHDQIASEVKEAHMEKAKEIQEYYMEKHLSAILTKIPAVIETGVGTNLYLASHN